MSPEIILDVILLIVLLIIGVPVPLCFAAAAVFLLLIGDFPSSNFLVSSGFTKLSSLILLAIPLYVFAGGLMMHSGIAVRLVDLANALFGRMRGGLGLVVIVATAIFGAISGMATAAVAAIGAIMIPRMVKQGYDRGYATALVACSSVLALLIPPSSSMILYGWVTNTSIAAVFLAPLIPALILVALFTLLNIFMIRNMPVTYPEPVSFKKGSLEVWTKTRRAAFGLAMPLIILGCIYGGVTTPTEAAAIAVAYSIPVGFMIYRELTFESFKEIAWKTGQIASVMMILIFFSSMLARVWTMESVPQDVMRMMLSVSEDPVIILLMINMFLLVIGMFIDDVSGVLLASPMLLPVAQQMGIDPIQFGAIVGVNLGMGLITPPTAPILYFGGVIGKTTLPRMIKPTLAFVLFAYLPVVLLVTFVPEVSMFLPTLLLDL